MNLRESLRNQTDVALSMAKPLLLKAKEEEKNVVFLPVSIHVVLSIIAAGSKGSTLDQLLSFLRSKSTDHLNSLASHLVADVLSDAFPDGGPRLSFVNGAWFEKTFPLHPSFKQIIHDHYEADVASVDFINKAAEVANEVNSWAKIETNGLIDELLPPTSVNFLTRLIFANALYFQGAWKKQFDASKTKDCDFHLLNGSSVKAPFMSISYEKQFISAFDGFKVLGLPYKHGEDERQFSMYIFLPDTKDELSTLVEKVASESGFLESKLPHQKVVVGDFRIPRFKISFGFEASELLKELGVVSPFYRGDLTEMLVDSPEGKNLQVSKIHHKSFVEVNEHGTEAAAVTRLVVRGGGSAPILTDFVADHPFLFLIREDSTGTVLFIGQVINPIAE